MITYVLSSRYQNICSKSCKSSFKDGLHAKGGTSPSHCLLVVLQLSLKIPRMIKEFWGVFIRDNILRTFGFGGLSINFTKDLRSFLRRRGKKKQIATFSDAPKSEFMELICKKKIFLKRFFRTLSNVMMMTSTSRHPVVLNPTHRGFTGKFFSKVKLSLAISTTFEFSRQKADAKKQTPNYLKTARFKVSQI